MHFNLGDIDKELNLLKSPEKLRDALALLAGADGDAAKSAAGSIASWHVQSGAGAMAWAGSNDLADVAVGGSAGDTLNGGGGNDALVGLGGADSLIGGTGTDTITSSEAADHLKLDGRVLNGDGTLLSDSTTLKLWMDLGNPSSTITYRYDVPTQKLTVVGAGSVVVINNFVDGDVGIFIPKKPEDPRSTTARKAGINTNFRNALPPPIRRDPLAIDLNGNGIETVGIGATPILFDHNADGIRTGTGWVQANDAWLALDRNGNGLIDSGRELFGVDTVRSGTPGVDAVYASTGFEALATLDSNSDRVFNASDAAFTQVRLWQDLNQDGISQSTELFTLAQKNIASIGLTPTTGTVNLGNGNTVTGQAVVTRTDNSTTQIDSVAVGADRTAGNLALASNPFYRSFPVQPLTTTALALPEMAGSGVVRDLREAMSLGNAASAALVSAVQAFSQGATRDLQLASLDVLLRTWAATEAITDRFNIEPVGAETRRFVVTGSTDTTLQSKLARIIPVLEVFNGVTVDESGWTSTVAQVNGVQVRTYTMAAEQAVSMQASYDTLSASVYPSLVAQTRLKPYLSGIELVIDANGARFDTTMLASALETRRLSTARESAIDVAELLRYASPTLQAAGFDGLNQLRLWVDALPSNSPIRVDLASVGVGLGNASGSNGADVLLGDQGNNSLWGNGGDDLLAGGNGNDWLSGGAGDDMLDGGIGNDTLDGGLGNNVYLFGKGDRQDLIRTYNDAAVGKLNTLQFKAGVAISEVVIKQVIDPTSGSNKALEVSIVGTTDKVTISGFFVYDDTTNIYNPVQQIKFADGTVWNLATIQAKLYAGTLGNDTLRGTVAADAINGGAGDDNLSGAGGNDTVNGGDGNDGLYGEAGNDMLSGGSGDDFLNGGDGDDTLDGGFGNDNFYGRNGNDTLDCGADNDNLDGGDGDDKLDGGADNDHLRGGYGNDMLDGGAGNDTLSGDTGNNVYLFGKGDGQDLISYTTYGATADKLNTLQFKSGVDPSEVVLRKVYDADMGSNALEVSIASTTDKVIIKGFFYNSNTVNDYNSIQIKFADGTTWETTTIQALLSTNIINGTAAAETLAGSGWGTQLYGFGGNDTLSGTASDDWLDGGTGNDVLIGGLGNDVYGIDAAGDAITESPNEGIDAVRSSITASLSSLGANLESLVLTGNAAINGTGNAQANRLFGNSSANRLDGGAIADVMTGGAGNDTYVVDNAGDVIIEFTGEGTDAVEASIAWTLGNELENLTLTGTASVNGTGNGLADVLTGNAGINTLTGGAGDDTLNGGAGADTLVGGAGNDTYLVENLGNVVTELTGEGTDTVEASLSWALGAELENLRLSGTAAINATGNSLANTLTGNGSANTLIGGAGNDTLDGGAGVDSLLGGTGDDTYVVDNAADTLAELAAEGIDTVNASLTWTLGTEFENLTLTGGAAISGTGNALANVLTGNSGSNRLDGAAGADALFGGAGNDTYVVDNVGDSAVELAGGGTDTVEASITWTLASEIELLTLAGTASINGTGNSLANTLTGNAGANRLNGGVGADAMTGGAGDDTYVVDSAGDTTVELTAGGIDTVESSIAWTLAADTENLTLIAGTAPQNGTGNALNNRLLGNAGINVLSGGEGNDWLRGVIGADTLLGGAGNDEYIVDDALAVVTELAGEGYDSVYSSTTRTITANIEALVLTGSAAINGTGNELGNRMNGASNTSANVLTGGLGDDTYVVGASDTTIEVAGGGNDTVEASISWTLGAELENLTLTGTEALHGTGNSVSNTLTGNFGANVLVGGAGNDWINGIDGADTMVGGIGNDHYVVDNVADIVTELAAEGVDQVYAKVNWTLGAHLDNLILWGTSALTGSGNELANRLTGSDAANVLNGLGSDDTLYGAAGSDTLYGGVGNDSLIADARLETIVVKARASLAANVGANMEVRLDGALIGSTLVSSTTFADYSFSTAVSAGKDAKLDVVFTNDALIDGLDRNLYVDSVRVGSHVMRPTDAGVTRDIGSGVAAFDGVNVLPGDVGLFWDASLRFTVPAAVVGAAAGDDLLYGEAGNDYLSGGLGNDRLDGGADADTLDGGGGDDTYIGGLGADVLTDASTLSNDVYVWGRGEGADVLTDAGGVDRIDVLAGAADSQIWLRQVGSNLELSVIGTADSLTINNWYANSANRVESFKLADGQALMAS